MLRSIVRLGTACGLAGGLAACDFDVANPGPTPDEFLDRLEAHQAVANGAARQLFDALNEVTYTTSAVTRELFPAGSTSSFGISIDQQAGRLTYDDEHVSWTNLQQARFIAESGFARFEANEDVTVSGYKPAADAALWAGYANRLLGQNWCEAAIDGGPIVTRAEVLERARDWFTKAIEVAGSTSSLANVRMAAIAARASVLVDLNLWAEAVQDAAQVPSDFVFNAEYHDTEQGHYNRTYFAGADQPYRAVTAWNTKYVDYYADTQDPRTPWVDTGQQGDASVGLVGARVPFYRQLKHDAEDSGIRLSSGWEMRLIEAENALRGGDVQGALDMMNVRRSALGLPDLTAADELEAWTALKHERGVELWLEGRRLDDLRRWNETGTPGDLHPLEQAGNPASYLAADQSLCYQIPKNERETNPNIPVTP